MLKYVTKETVRNELKKIENQELIKDYDGISLKDLELAYNIFIFIVTPEPPENEYWIAWHDKYSELMDRCTLRRLLSII